MTDAADQARPSLPGGGFAAVVLAGGRATRMGGRDKTALVSNGVSLLHRAVAAADGATRVVIVGMRDGTSAPAGVLLTRENPPWAGPAAAMAAGLAALSGAGDAAPYVLVLAADLPRAPQAVSALLAGGTAALDDAAASYDAFLAVDDEGWRQPLLALYRRAALESTLEAHRAAGTLTDLSMRHVLERLGVFEIPVPSILCSDVDTPDDASAHGYQPVDAPAAD